MRASWPKHCSLPWTTRPRTSLRSAGRSRRRTRPTRKSPAPKPGALRAGPREGGVIVDDFLRQALELVALGVPVLPLREGKGPFGNCRDCTENRCGGRPNMKAAGACECPRPCHAWAAATTSVDVVTSAAWMAAWRKASAVAYHPGGVGLTLVDLDNADAVAWARETLPATRTVMTTRGQHWIYLGTMQSANNVRPGV